MGAEMSGQVGGAAGRWVGPGVVYVMTYTYTYRYYIDFGLFDQTTKYYKIGCTSRDPEIRLKEVERKERKHRGNDSITIELLGFVHADEMRTAETIAQQHAKETLHLKKDRSRGNATDWFTGDATGQQVLDAVGEACKRSVYEKKDLVAGTTCYSTMVTNITKGPLELMKITAKAVKEADKDCKPGYVFVTKQKMDELTTHYRIDSTEGDPVQCVQERKTKEKVEIKLIGFVYTKKMDHAKEKAVQTALASGYKRVGPEPEKDGIQKRMGFKPWDSDFTETATD
jgi:hypothetical protein